MFGFFKKRKKAQDEEAAREKRANDESSKLLRQMMEDGYLTIYTASTHAMMCCIWQVIESTLTLNQAIDILVDDEVYRIDKDTFVKGTLRTSRLEGKDPLYQPVKKSDKPKFYYLEITLVRSGSLSTLSTLLIHASSFMGLYLIVDDQRVDLTGTIPECKSMSPLIDIHRYVTGHTPPDGPADHPIKDNVVMFKSPTQGKH